jgi:DNA-3-methyladenine glycosylase
VKTTPDFLKIMPRSFYARSPKVVARNLIGKLLIRNLNNGEQLIGRIIETEAYLGLSDPASYSFRGETPANAVLFGPPGFTHVYLIYGINDCLSISSHRDGQAGGVLLRALNPIAGLETMTRLRGLSGNQSATALTGGPGKLCKAFGINRKDHNNIDVTSIGSPIQVLDDGYRQDNIQTSIRIGITKAREELLRFTELIKKRCGLIPNRRS